MTLKPCLLTAALAAALTLSACRKEAPAEAPQADAAAPTAEIAPAAVPATETATETKPEPTAEELSAQHKQKAIDRALAEQQLLEDPNGQWATGARASSTYATLITASPANERRPEAATGVPDAQTTGYDSLGWQPEKDGAGIEWLELDFANPVHATALRVRQIDSPGAIIKIELIDESGARHTVWQGRDDTAYESDQIGWMIRTFDRTDYKVKGARLTLATNAVSGHESIDAVQLVGG